MKGTRVKPTRTNQHIQSKYQLEKAHAAHIPQMAIDIVVRCQEITNDRYLRLPSVLQKTGRAKATIYNDVNKGVFPPPIAISTKVSAWKESEVNAWMEITTFSSRSCISVDMNRFVTMLISPSTKPEAKTN